MSLQAAFREQAASCAALGSPFMAQLLEMLAVHWPSDTALAAKFAAFNGDLGPSGHSIPLRVAGGLHALVLTGRDPAMAAVYPPHTPDTDMLRDAVSTALRAHETFLLDWTDSAPQTNEVRRASAMIAGARVAATHFDLPLYLSELGASGGLNLMWDHYALDVGGVLYGPTAPAITLAPDWTGPVPPNFTPLVAARCGVDLNPLNPQNSDDLLRLTAYLWPDQPERLALTRAAARVMNAPIDTGDAVDWLEDRLHTAPSGHLHLVQHSVAWQYFPPEVQKRGTALMEVVGAKATRDRPLAWLSMEADGGKGAAITLRLWPSDITLALGRADFHGRWINWDYDGTID